MKTTTFVAAGAAALVMFWTAFAFFRFQMIMTIACGFAGTSTSDRLIADARMSFLFGCFGASLLTGTTLACLIQRARMTRKHGHAPAGYPHPVCAGLPSV